MQKRFNRKLKAYLNKLDVEIELYERHVDNILAALEPLAPGVWFDKEDMKRAKKK